MSAPQSPAEAVTYAGDVDPAKAWEMLANDPQAVMVDVRTTAEWAYVGLPDLGGIGKELLRVNWKVFPGMEVYAGFVDELRGRIKRAFNLLFGSKLRRQAAIARVREELPDVPEVERLLRFLESSERGVSR